MVKVRCPFAARSTDLCASMPPFSFSLKGSPASRRRPRGRSTADGCVARAGKRTHCTASSTAFIAPAPPFCSKLTRFAQAETYKALRSLRVTAGTVVAALEVLGSQRLAVEVSAAHALEASQCACIAPPSEMFNAPRNLQVTASLVAAAHEALDNRGRAVGVSAAHALQAAQCDAMPPPFLNTI